MSISLGEKVFIQWNEPSSKKQGVSHICMFGEKMLSNNTEHMIQSTHALYFRFKQYSSLYHDYLIDYSTKQDEILPHGCLELFINHFHLNQDKNAIPILSSVLNNIYSVCGVCRLLIYSFIFLHQQYRMNHLHLIPIISYSWV